MDLGPATVNIFSSYAFSILLFISDHILLQLHSFSSLLLLWYSEVRSQKASCLKFAGSASVGGGNGGFVTIPCPGTYQKVLFAEQTSSFWLVDSCAWECVNEPALMSKDTAVEQNRKAESGIQERSPESHISQFKLLIFKGFFPYWILILFWSS